jgi:ketosteroid isomerase-like protein
MITLLLSGCVGGFGKQNDETAIVKLFNQFTSAVKAKDISKIVSLCADEVTITHPGLVLSETELAQYLALGVSFVVEFKNYALNNLNIIITGRSAAVEATLIVDAETVFGDEQHNEKAVVFEVYKFADGWKITTFSEL